MPAVLTGKGGDLTPKEEFEALTRKVTEGNATKADKKRITTLLKQL
jgi:hypothetical protein